MQCSVFSYDLLPPLMMQSSGSRWSERVAMVWSTREPTLTRMMTDLVCWRERTKLRGVYWPVRGREPSLVHAALSVLLPLVVAIDDTVIGVEVVGEGDDGVVDWGAALMRMVTDLGCWRERRKKRRK